MLYKKYNGAFEEIARRNLDLMERATFDGLLAGGPRYKEAGERPCVHHSFTHAVALADALLSGLSEGKGEIVSDDFSDREKYYRELDSYRICKGNFIADFSNYDIGRDGFISGRGYATGGTMSLLYHKEKGLITASSLFKYTPAEVFNQQLTLKKQRFANLTPRAEITVDGKVYASCLDTGAEIKIDGNTVRVKTGLISIDNKKQGETELIYTFNENHLNIRIKGEGIKYILPVIGEAKIISRNQYTLREVFNFIPGFLAKEYTFEAENGEIQVDIII